MTPRQRIEGLTRSWYGYSVFAAMLSVLGIRASGPLSLVIGLGMSIVINTIGLVISIAVVTWLGRKLAVYHMQPEENADFALSPDGRHYVLNGTKMWISNSAWADLFTVLGALGVLGGLWAFLHEWSLASILDVVLMAACTMLNARSFRVLSDTGVRSYFV